MTCRSDALVLIPQPDEIRCNPEDYGCGGMMQRIRGLIDRGQPMYGCKCGRITTLAPDGGWTCEKCGRKTDETYGDFNDCLDCFCERHRPTLPLDQWVEKHLNPVFNPGCLGAACPHIPEGSR